MISQFREHLYPLDHPRLASFVDCDPCTYTDALRQMPVIGDALREWEDRFHNTTFRGITTSGTIIPGLFPLDDAENAPTSAAVDAAQALLDGLSPADRLDVTHPLNSKIWRAWMNPEIYLNRFGLRLEEHGAHTRELALDLIRASVSGDGYRMIRNLMHINRFLGELVNLPKILNEYSYNLNIFGSPSVEKPWGWSFYGHHICLNCAFIGDQQILTPTFLGAEPNEIDAGKHRGAVVLVERQQAGLGFITSLPTHLAERATLYRLKRDPTMPPGRLHPADELHLGGAFQDNRIIPREGLCLSECNSVQRDDALRLVEIFLSLYPEGPRAARMKAVREHLDDTWFCWIGGTAAHDPFYFRVQSPVIMIEFDHHAGIFLSNTEPQQFHIHTLVRTPNGNDYGAALISQATGTPQLLNGPA